MDDSPRGLRVASWTRGVIIGALIIFYGWFVQAPEGSFMQMFLVGAGVQALIIVLRKFVPPDAAPQGQYIFEILADGVTVLTFALGVFGSLARVTQAV
jgi:hypothetical protein